MHGNQGERPDGPAGAAVAVVGMACRVPGADHAGAFWRLLHDGVDAIAEAPADRWYDVPDLAPYRRGGFLDRVADFDAGFFGISPREAAAMDPQQRLALELGWEALEDAGLAPAGLRGSDTGGLPRRGRGRLRVAGAAVRRGRGVPRTRWPGCSRGLIANRVSHRFGLHGPSLAVDTAQSSSLVAVHLAAESLRSGGARLALAGGVHLNLAPESTLALARAGALSPDGRSYTFDARANGYVRGEGAGVVVLKPLADAVADGDPVYCLLLRRRGQQRRRRPRPDRAGRRRAAGAAAGGVRAGRGRSPAGPVRRAARHRHPGSATRSRPARSPRCSAGAGPPTGRCWSAR